MTKEITRRGKKVAAVKHVHGLSSDKKGKDTWLFKRSGASSVAAISQNEFVLRSESRNTNEALGLTLRFFETAFGVDYVFVEGFHSFSKNRFKVIEVICAKNKDEALELLKIHKNSVCIVTKKNIQGLSTANRLVFLLPKDKRELVSFISKSRMK